MTMIDTIRRAATASNAIVGNSLLCTEPFPLPADIRRKLEVLFMADFSAVRIYIDYLPEEYGALAFAQGHEIHILPGYFMPDTCAGVRLLAHELAHLVQQAQGRTKEPSSRYDLRVLDMDLEEEADCAADYCVYAFFDQLGASGTKMPRALTTGCRISPKSTYQNQPVQCVVITAAQSYQAFKTACYTYLSGFNATAMNALNHQAHMNHIYDNIYADYNGHNIVVPAKVALAGNALYQEMIDILNATKVAHHDNDIRVQTGVWPLIQGDPQKNALIAEYNQVNAGTILPAALTLLAQRATNRYLHVYPTDGRVVASNWRLAINLPPNEIADAVTALMPIMQANANIDHIKFAAPTMVGKPDSVIVYMRRNAGVDAAYTATEAAVRAAVVTAPAFNVVQQMNPMLNELVEGYAECAEAPVHGGSFGSFRCVLAYQAYLTMRKQYCQIRWGAGNYGTVADALFTRLGVPAPNNPEQQNALLPQPHFSVRAAIYRGLDAAWEGETLLGNN